MTPPTTRWDSAAYLRNDDEIAAYLSAVLEEDDPALLTHALGVIARAKGMIQLAPYILEQHRAQSPSPQRGEGLG